MTDTPPPSRPVFERPSIAQNNLELLLKHFPQAVEADEQGRWRINAQQLQLALDPAQADVRAEDGYELRWVGKKEAYHSAFSGPQHILRPLPQDSKNPDTTGNLLIKGDNLAALRLLRQSYHGQVKLIYIDPPYNTQSDAFIYQDNFSATQNQILEELGYSRENIDYIHNIYSARTHSGWLSFMYPRLLLAKELLREDGVIFISIDDHEQAQLRLLCDEVFGQDNFVANVLWQKKYAVSNDDPGIGVMHDHVLIYQKTEKFERNLLPRADWQKARYTNPDNDPRGPWAADNYASNKSKTERPTLWYPIKHPITQEDVWPDEHAVWRYAQDTHLEVEREGRLYWGKDYSYKKPRIKRYLHEVQQGVVPSTWWTFDDCGHNDEAQKETSELLSPKVFSTPKPIRLLQRILTLATQQDDLVMDFFAGSGATAEAVLRLNADNKENRRFILVQIPQPIDSKRQKEAHEFVTKTLGKEATIFEITAERIRRAGARLEAEHPALDTGFKVLEITDDPHEQILKKPLSESTQDDVAALQAVIGTPQPLEIPTLLANLLLAEGLPLTAQIETLREGALYAARAHEGTSRTAFIFQSLPLAELSDLLREQAQANQPITHLCLYTPWLADSNFLQGVRTLAQSLGYSDDKLRLRG
jgi:adenine-specific DNA-methyltransferase